MCDNLSMPTYAKRNHIITTLDDDDLPNIGYTAIRRAISTFNERQVIDILQYFLEFPPEPSDARRRMWWLTKEIRTYCLEFLYNKPNNNTAQSNNITQSNLPSHIACLIEEVLKLFPRSRTYKPDLEILTKQQYLGDGVRMRVINSNNNKQQWLHGYVEEATYHTNCVNNDGTDTDDDDDDDDASEDNFMRYKIVFINGQHCYLNEEQLLNVLFEGRYGFI